MPARGDCARDGRAAGDPPCRRTYRQPRQHHRRLRVGHDFRPRERAQDDPALRHPQRVAGKALLARAAPAERKVPVMLWLQLAWKEITNNGKFSLFFVLNLSIGLIGFIALDSFKQSIDLHLQNNSKSILTADVQIS